MVVVRDTPGYRREPRRALAIAVVCLVVAGSVTRGFAQPLASHAAHGHAASPDNPATRRLGVWGLTAALAVAGTAFLIVRRRDRRRRDALDRGAITGASPVSPSARRSFIKYGMSGLAAVGTGQILWRYGSAGAIDDVSTADGLSDRISPCFNNSPQGPPFTQPLPIPPALDPIPDATTDLYVISETRSETEIVPGFRTPIWGYDGMMPGPTILARKGRPVSITFANNLPPGEDPAGLIVTAPQDPRKHPFLDSSTVVHLHGINTDHFADGFPDDGDGHKHRTQPGGSFTHVYPNNEYQRPATLWYHDHSVHVTGEHVYRGLAGFYILQDEVEDLLRLPGSPLADPGRGYGHFDVPLLIKDVMIAPDDMDDRPRGTLVYNNCSHFGAFGDVMTVNGKQQPRFDVANRKYRFRSLNGSDARQYSIAFRLSTQLQNGPDQPFTLIGSDQGLLRVAVPTTDFHTTPSERWEFVVDFSKYPIGTRLVMVNKLVDPSESNLFRIMAFDVTRVEPDTSEVPPVLRGGEHPADFQPPAQQRTFLFHRQGGYWSINGMQWDPVVPAARPLVDTTEEWTLTNEAGGWGHPVHLHVGRFRIIDVQGRAPRPGELEGFKDTVWLGPNQTIRVVHQFWNFRGKFVFHCHNSSHEDHDMMLHFEIQPPPV
ncbi:MAG: Bilirubin oxidase [Acidobacteria bacterium]|nr:Bilirubin oxidase [Acidobacteriota bacterium]